MSTIKRYRADIGGDQIGWPIVVPDIDGSLCYYHEHIERIAAAEAQVAELQARLQRATDLARYARHHLHDEKAITDAEYAALVEDSDSGKRVARLEGYDRMRKELQAQIDALRSENQRLRAPVSDAEWDDSEVLETGEVIGRRQRVMGRSGINGIIRARAEAPQEKP